MAHFVSYNTDTHEADTPLAGGDEVTLGPLQTAQEGKVCGTVYADKTGTIYIEQSFDGGDNFDLSASYTVAADSGAGFEEDIIAPITQVRFVNGSDDQTVMRLYARCFGVKASGS